MRRYSAFFRDGIESGFEKSGLTPLFLLPKCIKTRLIKSKLVQQIKLITFQRLFKYHMFKAL